MGGRAQDQARPHRKAGRPSAETASLLARYRSAMRRSLSAVLDELEPSLPDPGLGLVKSKPVSIPVKEQIPRWDLAIKLARELGTEVDEAPPDPSPAAAPTRRRRKPDYGPDK